MPSAPCFFQIYNLQSNIPYSWLFCSLVGKTFFLDIIKDGKGQELFVFFGDYYEANGYALKGSIIIATLDMRPNHLCCNIQRRPYWRFDTQIDDFIHGELLRDANQRTARTDIHRLT